LNRGQFYLAHPFLHVFQDNYEGRVFLTSPSSYKEKPHVKKKLTTENLSEAGEGQVHMNEKPFLLCCFNYLY
jgi:hypothetical protein